MAYWIYTDAFHGLAIVILYCSALSIGKNSLGVLQLHMKTLKTFLLQGA